MSKPIKLPQINPDETISKLCGSNLILGLDTSVSFSNPLSVRHTPSEIAVVSDSKVFCFSISEMLKELGLASYVVSTSASVETIVANNLCIFVDTDSFSDVDTAIDYLVSLRRRDHKTPVLILSASFSYDEYECCRSLIADVSLRIPVTRDRLILALHQACVNRNLTDWA